MQAALLRHRRIRPAHPQPVRRQRKIIGRHDLHPRWIAVDRCRAFDGFGDCLEADPAAGVARQRKAEDAEIEIILQRCRIEDRHHRCGEYLFALVRQGRRLAAVVVAGKRKDAAVARRTRRIGMLERVHRAVDAGPLPVPDAEDAIDLGAGIEADLLATPDRGRGQILVEAGYEGDVIGLQMRLGPPQRMVVHAERRPAIAGDETCGLEIVRAIALALQQRQPDQRLDARKIDPPGVEPVFVVQVHLHQRHALALSIAGTSLPGNDRL